MITLRPWKGSKNEFEVDVIVNGPKGRTLRKRVKAPVTGKSSAERWAKALENELLAQLLAPEPEPEKPPAQMFEEFAKTFLDLCRLDRLGANTLRAYTYYLDDYLLPVLAKRRIDQVTPEDIKKIKRSLETKSLALTEAVLKTLRRIFYRAITERVIDKPPVEFDVPRRIVKAPIAYDSAQQAALLAVAHALGTRYVVMVLLGFDGGLRRGEILALHWSDINMERGIMTIRRNIVLGKLDVPKGRSEDEVGITSRLAEALLAHPRTGPFVLDNDGTHFSLGVGDNWMRQLVERAGVPWHGTHILRKTCGTRIADGGGGVAAVASHLRHKDLSQASRYIDRTGGTRRALRALEG